MTACHRLARRWAGGVVVADRSPLALEPPFAADWAAASDDAARLRVVIDQVASLTDVSAAEWHGRLVPPPRR